MQQTLNIEAAGRDGEFRRGWPVLIAAMLGIGLGLAAVSSCTAAGFAPRVFGMILDATGDFAAAPTGSAIALPICAAGFLPLGRYPKLR